MDFLQSGKIMLPPWGWRERRRDSETPLVPSQWKHTFTDRPTCGCLEGCSAPAPVCWYSAEGMTGGSGTALGLHVDTDWKHADGNESGRESECRVWKMINEALESWNSLQGTNVTSKLNVECALIWRHSGQHQEPVISAMCLLSDRQK